MSYELLDEFSQWVSKEQWCLSYYDGSWIKDIYNKPLQMSELYKVFLKCKEETK